MEEYIILAHSPSLNQTVRELQLTGTQPATQAYAQQLADSFALRQRQSTGRGDWYGLVEQVDPNNHFRTE